MTVASEPGLLFQQPLCPLCTGTSCVFTQGFAQKCSKCKAAESHVLSCFTQENG